MPIPEPRRPFDADGDEDLRTALPKLVADVARETTVAAVTTRIAAMFVHALGARSACVYLTGPDGSKLSLAAAADVDSCAIVGLDTLTNDDESLAAVAVRLGLLQRLDAPADTTAVRARVSASGSATGATGCVALAFPLFAGVTTVGAVRADFDALAPDECHALDILSPALGAIVDGARIRGELAELETSARMREEQLALVVHELRQPLSLLVLSAAQLARRAADDERQALDRLRKGVLRLDAMISDLSDASFLDSGAFALRLERTDIARLVVDCVEQLAPRARVSIDGEIAPLDVDPRRIEQILTNLLVNARKYGVDESPPSVAVGQRDDAVVIVVTNAGGRISADEREQIFEPYYRGRDRKPEARGLGLGLYICRRLVEEHGGRIWADSDASHTSVGFSLPAPETGERASGTRTIFPERG